LLINRSILLRSPYSKCFIVFYFRVFGFKGKLAAIGRKLEMVTIEKGNEISKAIEEVMKDLFTRFEAAEAALEENEANLPPINPESERVMLQEIEAKLDRCYPKPT